MDFTKVTTKGFQIAWRMIVNKQSLGIWGRNPSNNQPQLTVTVENGWYPIAATLEDEGGNKTHVYHFFVSALAAESLTEEQMQLQSHVVWKNKRHAIKNWRYSDAEPRYWKITALQTGEPVS